MPVEVDRPERFVEPEEALAQHSGAQTPERPAGVGRGRRFDPDRPGRQDGQRDRHDGRLGPVVGTCRGDLHPLVVGTDRRDRRVQPDGEAAGQVPRECRVAVGQEGVRAGELLTVVHGVRREPGDLEAPLGLVRGRQEEGQVCPFEHAQLFPLRHGRQCRRDRDVRGPLSGGVERFLHQALPPALIAVAQAALAQGLGDVQRVRVVARRERPRPEVGDEVGHRVVVDTVDPRRAEVDREARPGVRCPDPATDPVTGLEHLHAPPSGHEVPSRREAGHSGPDDQDPAAWPPGARWARARRGRGPRTPAQCPDSTEQAAQAESRAQPEDRPAVRCRSSHGSR